MAFEWPHFFGKKEDQPKIEAAPEAPAVEISAEKPAVESTPEEDALEKQKRALFSRDVNNLVRDAQRGKLPNLKGEKAKDIAQRIGVNITPGMKAGEFIRLVDEKRAEAQKESGESSQATAPEIPKPGIAPDNLDEQMKAAKAYEEEQEREKDQLLGAFANDDLESNFTFDPKNFNSDLIPEKPAQETPAPESAADDLDEQVRAAIKALRDQEDEEGKNRLLRDFDNDDPDKNAENNPDLGPAARESKKSKEEPAPPKKGGMIRINLADDSAPAPEEKEPEKREIAKPKKISAEKDKDSEKQREKELAKLLDEAQNKSAEAQRKNKQFAGSRNAKKLEKELDKFVKGGTATEKGEQYDKIGQIYKEVGNNQKANEFFVDAVNAYSKGAFHADALNILIDRMGDFDLAEKYLENFGDKMKLDTVSIFGEKIKQGKEGIKAKENFEAKSKESRKKYEEARKAYVKALIDFEKSKKTGPKSKSAQKGRIEVNLLNPKAVLEKREESLKENLAAYRKECLAAKEEELKLTPGMADGQKEAELQKYAKELVIETTAKEAAEIYNLKLQEKIEQAGERKEWLKEKAFGAADWYRHLGFKKKMAISGALIGTGVAAVAIGGVFGAVLGGSAFALRTGGRVLGGIGTYVGTEEYLKKFHEGSDKKYIEKSIEDKNFISAIRQNNSDLNEKLFKLYGGKKNEEIARHIGGAAGATALFLGSLLVGDFARDFKDSLPDDWIDGIKDRLGSAKDFIGGKLDFGKIEESLRESHKGSKAGSSGLSPETVPADSASVKNPAELKPFQPDEEALRGFYSSKTGPEPALADSSATADSLRVPEAKPDSVIAAAQTRPDAAVPSVETGVAPPASPDAVEVKQGDSVWKIVENRLESNENFNNLNDAQKTYVIDHFKDQIEADPEKFGLADVDKINVGDKINLGEIGSGDEMNEAIAKAQGLSESQMENIRNYSPDKVVPAPPDNLPTGITEQDFLETPSEEISGGQIPGTPDAAERMDIESEIMKEQQEEYDRVMNPVKGDYNEDILKQELEKFKDFSKELPEEQAVEQIAFKEFQGELTGQENLNSQEFAQIIANSKIPTLDRQTLQMHSRIISGFLERLKELSPDSEEAERVKRSIGQFIKIDENNFKNKNLFSKEIKKLIE